MNKKPKPTLHRFNPAVPSQSKPKKRLLRADPSSGLPPHGRIIRIGGKYRDLRRIEAHPATTAAPSRPQSRAAYSARIAQFGSAALR